MHILKILSGPVDWSCHRIFYKLPCGKNAVSSLASRLKSEIGSLPFTPGVIPRGKARLARALGSAVGESLLTKKDLEQMLLSDGMSSRQ